MNPFKRLAKWLERLWRRRRQKIDLEILWPAMKRAVAENYAEVREGVIEVRPDLDASPEAALEVARRVFIRHMNIDEAWKLEFTSEEDLADFVRSKLV